MNKHKMYQFGIVFIIMGVIIGFIIAGSFDLTRKIGANPLQSQEGNPSNSSLEGSSAGVAALEGLSTAFANVADQVNPSVVTIFTETIIKQRRSPFFQFPFEEFFGEDFQKYFQSPQVPEHEQKQYGLGSGVIVSADGIIITNNHVVEGADNIKIRLIDEKEYRAEIKGVDPRSDLAIIKIDAGNLPYLKMGDAEKARVGEWVLAIGSPLSPELAHTVTSGIISAKGRSGIFDNGQYEDFIQTDAAINPGNSGGALVNLRGQLIGINTAIASRTGGFMGIGFAIPSNLAQKVMNDILQKGKVVRGWLGVIIQDVNPEIANALDLKTPTGALISSVQEGSPAEKAGLKSEDVVIKFGAKSVKNSRDLSNLVAAAEPNEEVVLTVLRDGKEKEIKVKLAERLEDQQTITQVQPNAVEKVGMEVADITPDLIQKYELKVKKDGVVITKIEKNSLASQSGLQPGDVILKINRKDIRNVSEYNEIIDDVKAGDTLLFYIQRNDSKLFVAFTLPKE
jgi:serine protease Do